MAYLGDWDIWDDWYWHIWDIGIFVVTDDWYWDWDVLFADAAGEAWKRLEFTGLDEVEDVYKVHEVPEACVEVRNGVVLGDGLEVGAVEDCKDAE